MIAKIITYMDDGRKIEAMHECDTVRFIKHVDSIEVDLYNNSKGSEELVQHFEFAEKTRLFVMEKGKTVDRIDFKC